MDCAELPEDAQRNGADTIYETRVKEVIIDGGKAIRSYKSRPLMTFKPGKG